MLLDMGYRTIAPDMIGYGDTEAPRTSPTHHLDDDTELSKYTFKRVADDMATLAKQLGVTSTIAIGHDWGAMIAYRFALWYPDLVRACVAVCVPFIPAQTEYRSPEDVAKLLPNFGYQVFVAGPELETKLKTKKDFQNWFNAIFGGKTSAPVMDVRHGYDFEALKDVGPSPIVPPDLIDFYAEKYTRNGMHGPCNWYRTRKLNFEEEKALLPDRANIACPTLFIQANQDAALPPSMAQGMERHFKGSLRKEAVNSSHWALWQAKDEVNKYIREFLIDIDSQNDSKL